MRKNLGWLFVLFTLVALVARSGRPHGDTAPRGAVNSPWTQPRLAKVDVSQAVDFAGVRVGMRWSDVVALIGEPVSMGADWIYEGCSFLPANSGPSDVKIYFANGRVHSVWKASSLSQNGRLAVYLGDSEKQVREVFGDALRIERYPHSYAFGATGPDWHVSVHFRNARVQVLTLEDPPASASIPPTPGSR